MPYKEKDDTQSAASAPTPSVEEGKVTAANDDPQTGNSMAYPLPTRTDSNPN